MYKDSALKAVKQVQSDESYGFTLKYTDGTTVKKYEELDDQNDIISKVRQQLGVAKGLRYQGGAYGYGADYETIESLEQKFKDKMENMKRRKID